MKNNENQLRAESQFAYVCDVFHLINAYKDNIDSILKKENSPTRVYVLGGLWYRAYLWLKTLSKPNTYDSLDVQLFASSSRSLFEIVVDMLLIYEDKTDNSAQKFKDWIDSEKLNCSEKLTKFFTDQDKEIPEKYSERMNLIKNHKTEILQKRIRNWGPGKNGYVPHPPKWNNDKLAACLKGADKVLISFSEGRFPLCLEEYYLSDYPLQSWNTHSGLTAFWDIEQEALFSLSASFLQDIGFFGLLIMDILVTGLELIEVMPNYETDRNKIFKIRKSRELKLSQG